VETQRARPSNLGMVDTSFEPGHLELVSLRSAYAWVVPVRRRSIRREADGVISVARPAPVGDGRDERRHDVARVAARRQG